MGRDHSSDEDFVVDEAAPDLDDSPDVAGLHIRQTSR
ncbi:hypothetical protein PF003_g29440 [Phytophthora fragariae]|nr:hypothetical protein PF003_g29440 [Phytophthora fragariae]